MATMNILKLLMEVFLMTFVVTVLQCSAAVNVSVASAEVLEELVMTLGVVVENYKE